MQTVGGLLGTIVELRDDEVVLKIDESTGTRAHVARSAVQAILKKGPEENRGAGEASVEAPAA